MDGKCKCISYNDPQPWQTVPSVVLALPDWAGGERRTVCVDACIAGSVQALWDARVLTEGSCCGHGDPTLRSVVVNRTDRKKAEYVLASIDPTIHVAAWELVYSEPRQ